MKIPEDRPLLMGILNVTPDSFSDGGQFFSEGAAVEHALNMVRDGADLIDVGGESTRPGANAVAEDEELHRVIPVIQALSRKGIPTSIDTMKPEVARRALGEGAQLINDVSGFRDRRMVAVAAEFGCTVCVMHMLGEPRTMQVRPEYGDVVSEVVEYLRARADELAGAGVLPARIWVDPGIGFGKTVDHNLSLLKRLPDLAALGYPVVVGVSRKSFIGKLLGGNAESQVQDRLFGTVAAQVIAQLMGARVIRAHDVRAAKDALVIAAAVAGPPGISA